MSQAVEIGSCEPSAPQVSCSCCSPPNFHPADSPLFGASSRRLARRTSWVPAPLSTRQFLREQPRPTAATPQPVAPTAAPPRWLASTARAPCVTEQRSRRPRSTSLPRLPAISRRARERSEDRAPPLGLWSSCAKASRSSRRALDRERAELRSFLSEQLVPMLNASIQQQAEVEQQAAALEALAEDLQREHAQQQLLLEQQQTVTLLRNDMFLLARIANISHGLAAAAASQFCAFQAG